MNFIIYACIVNTYISSINIIKFGIDIINEGLTSYKFNKFNILNIVIKK